MMLAEVHDGDAVGDVPHHRQVVGHEDVGEPELVLDVLQQVDDLRLDRDVERGHRLVADDELRPQRTARAIPMRWRWPPENSLG
jgi:serine kinase of HPr protein (carbohydrate metabolism regulator)